MAFLGEARGIPHYPCPMCGSPVYSTALRCSSCGTDLTRAGVMFTSSGGGVEGRRSRRPTIWAALVLVLSLAGAAAVAGWPRVEPWVEQFAAPGMTVARTAANRAIQSVRQLLSQLPAKVRRAVQPQPAASGTSASKAGAPKAPAATPRAPAPTQATTVPAAVLPMTIAPVVPEVVASAPEAGTVIVASTPRGARVQVDGLSRGVTPVTIGALRAGLHRIRVSHPGYRPVVATLFLEPGRNVRLGISLKPAAPPKVVTRTAPPAPAQARTVAPLEVGRPAPQLVAKDRIGILYRMTDFRGQKLVLVFVERLDAEAQRVIRELDALRAAEAIGGALVVVVRPDRTAIRQFVLDDRIQIPVLFGNQAIARAYGVAGQRAVLYLVSEQGYVVRRQAGRIDPRAIAD